MKRILLLASSALLLLAGCAKELQGPEGVENGLQDVVFTASMAGDVATKAAADGDGAAASVNRCIMEIYYGDALFARQYAAVSGKTASFTAQLVSNRTYTVAFWADCVEDATSAEGLAADQYYVTDGTNGLKAVSLKGSYVGNKDARDAFALCGNYTVQQGGSAFNVTLKRPFAQVNVITNDVATVAKVSTLAPDSVKLTIKNAVSCYNVLDSTAVANETSDLVYSAKVYDWDSSKSECTLSMDYLFAENEKKLVDIEWSALHTGDAAVAHSFANIPYQRNYRTNIKGALLTTTGQWNVTVDPVWNQPDELVVFKVVNNIAAANDVVEANKGKKEINVTFSSEPEDAGDPAQDGNNAIVTSLLSENAVYNIDVASVNEVLYVGDYAYDTTGTTTTYNYDKILAADSDSTKAASVNLVVTDSKYIGTLVVNSPSKSVYINGQTLESGKSYHIENLTVTEVSMNTIIIESGMSVGTLTMVKGGLEIHGTVNSAVIPNEHGTIKVRECEGLSETVYNTLKPYIDVENGYFGEQESGKSTYCIRREVVATIGSNNYYTIAQAFAAAADGNTITLVKDCETGTAYSLMHNLALTADNVTLDLNEQTLTTTVNMSVFIAGNNITVKNGKIYAGANAGKQSKINSYAINVGSKTKGTSATGIKFQDVELKGGIAFGGAEDKGTPETEYQGSGVGTIENCTIQAGDFYVVCTQMSGSYATVISGDFKKGYYGSILWAADNTTISLKGGTYDADPSTWVAKGYGANKTSESPASWTVIPAAAKISSTLYDTFAEAWAAVQTGETITLLDDASLADALIPSGTVTIDLNSNKITSSATYFTNQYNASEIHFTGAGAIVASGTIRLYDSNAYITFDEAFTGTVDYKKVDYSSGHLQFIGGYFKPASGYYEATYTNNYIPEGYFIEKITEGTYANYYKPTKITAENAYFQVGGNYFRDLTKALTEWNSADGNTLKVLNDAVITSYVANKIGENKTLTLDMNGNKLSTSYYQDLVDVWSGKLIITGNGTIQAGGSSCNSVHVNSGSVQIVNGTFKNKITAYGEMIIDGGTFEGSVYCTYDFVINGGTFSSTIQSQTGKTATINGGTFNSGFTAFGTVNFNDGTIEYITGQSNSTINISGGYVKKIYANSATWNITGGIFEFDPSSYVASGYKATKNGETWTVTAE